MKKTLALSFTILVLAACQPKQAADTAGVATATSNAPICEQYAQFVESYASKQAEDVKTALMKRLAYDKLRWQQDPKQTSDEYCQKSLERMQRMGP